MKHMGFEAVEDVCAEGTITENDFFFNAVFVNKAISGLSEMPTEKDCHVCFHDT